MAAQLKVFLDKDCSKELPISESGRPLLFLGTQKGLNGDDGEIWKSSVYVKNIGTRAALHTRLYLQNVAPGDEYLTIENPDIGDLRELEAKEVKLIVYVPRYTAVKDCTFQVILDYYTLPDIDEVFHNPYTDAREVVG
jgi:hypothetical protein